MNGIIRWVLHWFSSTTVPVYTVSATVEMRFAAAAETEMRFVTDAVEVEL